jgi:hypothetical protein
MTFASIPPGAAVFLDANTLVYHFTNDPKYGSACTQLLKRVELHQLQGFTSAHVLGDVAHRLMTLEAISLLGWPLARVAARLRKHHVEIPKIRPPKVHGPMRGQCPGACRPSAGWGHARQRVRGPVSAWLGGEGSPAAC